MDADEEKERASCEKLESKARILEVEKKDVNTEDNVSLRGRVL